MSDIVNPSLGGSPPNSPSATDSTSPKLKKMFSAVAPRYDFLNHFLSVGRDIAWRKATVKALRPILERPDTKVVDLCCGTGDLTFELERFSAGQVLGTDFCHVMLALAKTKARRRSTLFVEADTLVLPFAGESIDVASIAFGFRNLAGFAKGLGEIRRILKPRGILAILEFSEVRGSVFGPFFRFYFRHILPRIGTWISGVPGSYQYLHDSVSRFPNQEALSALLSAEGFRKVRYLNFTGGVAALHLAEKA